MGLCVQSTPPCDVLLTHGGNAHKQIRRHLTNAGTTTFACSLGTWDSCFRTSNGTCQPGLGHPQSSHCSLSLLTVAMSKTY